MDSVHPGSGQVEDVERIDPARIDPARIDPARVEPAGLAGLVAQAASAGRFSDLKDGGDGGDGLARLSWFRRLVYEAFTRWADELFELADALTCGPGPVRTPVELSLAGCHRRSHGSLYAGLNRGEIEIGRLRRAVAGLAMPRIEGRIVLGVDVSAWSRPAAETSPARMHCHLRGRTAKASQVAPGWPYSWVAALGPGRTSWTVPLDALRLRPGDDATAVTAGQIRDVVGQLRAAGHWRDGDPEIWIVLDAGYDVTRLAWLLADLPVLLIGRLRSNRVMIFPPGPQARGKQGRPPQHGAEMAFDTPGTWAAPDHTGTAHTSRYGHAEITAWHRLHPRLARRGPWTDHPGGRFGELPVIEFVNPTWPHCDGLFWPHRWGGASVFFHAG
jgi:hypothetical protein